MQARLSRRKIATYVASQAQNGVVPEHVVEEVAAYLMESRRVRELPLVVRAIEDALADRGVVVATITSARPLDDALRAAVREQTGGTEVHLREIIDPRVLGGIRLQTPDASYDGTVQNKLQALRAVKL
ncbi:F0F1 ATP synthase subunit delta [Candidatus Saccharibacteria bacterium]|nr:MAG: F0F1 ATP synthase subunit delta [Candidatus Saccharibacteria bacterium]